MTALNDLQDVGHMRLYRLQESIEDENVSLTTTAPPMTSLDPSQSLSFPIISTPTWYIPPQIHKRSPDPHNHKTQGGAEQFWMAPWTNENEQQLAKSPPSPVQPGPEHWEEQRRKWTQGFPVLHHLTQDVNCPFYSLERPVRLMVRIFDCSMQGMEDLYSIIRRLQNRRNRFVDLCVYRSLFAFS